MKRWIVTGPDGDEVRRTDSEDEKRRFDRRDGYTVLEAATETVHRADPQEESGDADEDEASPAPSSPSTHTDQENEWEPPTTSNGTPCTRCVDLGEPCWQHEEE